MKAKRIGMVVLNEGTNETWFDLYENHGVLADKMVINFQNDIFDVCKNPPKRELKRWKKWMLWRTKALVNGEAVFLKIDSDFAISGYYYKKNGKQYYLRITHNKKMAFDLTESLK